MIMTIKETIDSNLKVNNNNYSIKEIKDHYLLKTIHIPKKEPFTYAFLGGMWYSKKTFSLTFDEISLPYPFTTYYTIKILDKTINGNNCVSSIYVKMPVFVLQFSSKCYLIQFDPCITINNQEVFPFIHLSETESSYDISFFLPSSFEIKQKNNAWLGRGKKSIVTLDVQKDDSFTFHTNIKEYENWEEAIAKSIKQIVKTQKKETFHVSPEQVFSQAKQALWRSYDHKNGTFLQLPWRETPGFTFVDSSYSLLSYEAVRINYFSQWYEQTKDEDFSVWSKQLRNLFLNPEMHTTPKKQGEGIIWYNMTTLSKDGVIGYFYMDTGYSGYPGGQATIDLHLLQYLQVHPDKELEQLVRQSLLYILSTQKEDGSWPMAIKHEGLLKFRPEKLDQYTSFGGTAEAIRSLLIGSTYFESNEMKTAAIKGLDFLKENNPICYNGLRDIGIMEPEAFSAVSIIDAFLDAYEHTNDDSYIQNAKTYATYTFPWIYQWNSSNLLFFNTFHPISYSITPRLSPYETAWIISTYARLKQYTKDSFLTSLNISLFNQVTSWISKTGGLSEGVFPNGFSGFNRLPMEQTFATIELMKSAETLTKKALPKKEKKKDRLVLDPQFHLEKDNDLLVLLKNKETFFTFDASKGKITTLYKASLSETGITFSFYGSYNQKILKRKIKKHLRGNLGKYILGSKDAIYAVSGVKGPDALTEIQFDYIQSHLNKWDINMQSKDKAIVTLESPIHTIQIMFQFSNNKEEVYVDMTIQISVKNHDLSTRQLVLFPLIGSTPISVSKNNIKFKGFTLSGDCVNIIQHKSITAINQTLSTNWTHAGMIKKEYQISVPI